MLFVVPDFKFGLFGIGGAFNEESSAMRSINDCVPGSTSLWVRCVFAVIAFLLNPRVDCWLRNCLSGSWIGSSPINSWQRATAAASFASAVVAVGLGSPRWRRGCPQSVGSLGWRPGHASVAQAAMRWAAGQPFGKSTGRSLESYRPLAPGKSSAQKVDSGRAYAHAVGPVVVRIDRSAPTCIFVRLRALCVKLASESAWCST